MNTFGGKYVQLLQGQPDPNNGTMYGGLGSVLQKALMGYGMGQDQREEEAKQGRLEAALRIGMGTPANPIADAPGAFAAGSGGPPPMSMDPARQPVAGDWSGMIGALSQDYPELSLQMMGQERNAVAAARAAEAARLQGIKDDQAQFLFEVENGPGSTIKTAEGIYSLNSDGTLGTRLGSPVVSGGDTYSFGAAGPQVGTIPQGYQLMQMEDGGWVMAAIPGGPADIEQQALAAEASQAAAIAGDEGQYAIDLIDRLITHPGLPGVVGMPNAQGGLLGGAIIRGTDEASFSVLLDQVQGKAFLDAYQKLKGSGTITEIEGAKAEAAIARLGTAQKEEDFIAAAQEFQSIIQAGMARQSGATPAPAPADTGSSDGWGELQEVQ